MMDADHELLARFVSRGDESAFRLLVERHLPLVHGVARRVTANDELARDVSQQVFVRLARRASRISANHSLAGWLHRVTRHLAIDLVRAEARRKRREQRATETCSMESSSSPNWAELSPVVDDLVDRLSGADRDVVLLRFFQNKPHAEVARQLGFSEAAAKKRATRALEKLRRMLARKGVTSSSAALVTLLQARASTPVSDSLVSGVASAMKGVAPEASGLFSHHIAMTTAQKAVVASASLVFLASFGYSVRGFREEVPVASRVPAGDSKTRADASLSAKSRERHEVSLSEAERLERIREILGIEGRMERTRAMLAFIDVLKTDQLGDTLRQLNEFEGDASGRFADLVLATWAKLEPIAAAEWGLAYGDDGVLRRVLEYGGEHDPEELFDWLLRNAPEGFDPKFKGRTLPVVLLETVALKDVTRAVEILEHIPKKDSRETVLATLGRRLMTHDSRLFDELLAACGKGPGRRLLLVEMTSWLIQKGRAREMLEYYIDDNLLRKQVDLESEFYDAARTKLEETKSQLDGLPEGRLKDHAVAGVCIAMAELTPRVGKDVTPEDVFEMLASYPEAANQDVVVKVLKGMTFRDQWRESWRVRDEERRADILEASLLEGAVHHSAEVLAWMRENEVPDRVRATVLEDIQQRREE